MPSSLPALSKTWQFSLNTIVTAQGTADNNLRAYLRQVKNAMKAFGSSPWTVVGSSNGVAFSVNDGVDRWTANADMPDSSWLILKQTGIAANWQLLFHRVSTFGCQYFISPSAGFTGGGALTRPTATDLVTIPTINTGA